MYQAFSPRAAFYVVYIAEAHAEDGWQTRSNEQEGVVIKQHTTLEERRAAARRCASVRASQPTIRCVCPPTIPLLTQATPLGECPMSLCGDIYTAAPRSL